MQHPPPRWIYRFVNYARAYRLLQEAVALSHQRALSSLEKEGMIQRFEYTWELAWKLLKDYLTANGLVPEVASPAHVMRTAFMANIVTDGDVWMETIEARNLMSHMYDNKKFEMILEKIAQRYLPLFTALHDFMQREEAAHG